MGQCFSTRQPAVAERRYHQRYSTHARQLANVEAGRRGNNSDEYIVVRYRGRISEILRKSYLLQDRFEEIRVTHVEGHPITNAVMKMRCAIDSLRREYESFFRDSAWKVDDLVHERKRMASDGYFNLESLKDSVEALTTDAHDRAFDVCVDKISKLILIAEKLHRHMKFCRNEIDAETEDDEDVL